MFEVIASRRFTLDDQRWFAGVSDDVNPMHLDPVAARRTPAGTIAVHGIHALLWAIDCFVAQSNDSRALRGMGVRFERFVPVDEEVVLWAETRDASVVLEIRSGQSRLISITLRLISSGKIVHLPVIAAEGSQAIITTPVALNFEETHNRTGTIPLEVRERPFRAAAQSIGTSRVSAIIRSSYLVGMLVPGLHSIFAAIDFDFVADDGCNAALRYAVVDRHEIFRMLTIAIGSPGITGKVQAFVRLPPVVQPTIEALAARVIPHRYAGLRALIIGGSRGLGEITAKLLAAGGADVTITYLKGVDDAHAVAAEIRNFGGTCDVSQLDIRMPISPQLKALSIAPDHVYYFATTKIFLQKSGVFAADTLANFQQVYVSGFAQLCAALTEGRERDLLAFYPSSVAVADRPRGMTEYAMAKAAGEILCADLDRFMPRVRTLVERLPRLLTDQTATVTPAETPPADGVMHAIVDRMFMALPPTNLREGLEIFADPEN